MIALCQEHHAKADAGAFTSQQLHALKAQARLNAKTIKGRFDWMRKNLMAVVGGSFYIDTPVILTIDNRPVISFTRDDENYLLLNLQMLTTSEDERFLIQENFWLLEGTPEDVECPPHGRLLSVKYPNGDKAKVEFFSIDSTLDFSKRYGERYSDEIASEIPFTIVEIRYFVDGMDIDFGQESTKVGSFVLNGCFFRNVQIPVFQREKDAQKLL